MSSNTLFVPVEIKALVVNDLARKGQNFQRWKMNYTNLKSYASPMPDAFSGNTAIDWNSTQAANGVYLHWTLPNALRKGVLDNITGTTEYPLVPNRWVIIRYSGALESRAVTAWVVESDFLDPNNGSSAYIDPNSSDSLKTTLIGQKLDLSGWSESGSSELFLTAVGAGDMTFAAYQPYVENVFSIHDPLTGISDSDTLSYMVAGWYSDPSKDILADATDGASFQTLITKLNWQVDNAQMPCSTSLYQGLIYGITWNKSGPIPRSNRPVDSSGVTLAVGNTSIDGLTALIDEQSKTLGVSVDVRLLEAFQYNLLPVLDQPNGPELLYQAIHKAWFGSLKGGYEWVVVKKPTDQSGADSKVPYPESTTDWTDADLDPAWLATLNQNQALFDEAERLLHSLQWKLYSMWWIKGKFDNIGLNNQNNLKDKNPDFTDSYFEEQLNPAASGTAASLAQQQAKTVASLLSKVPSGNTQEELQSNIQQYATNNKLPDGYELKRYARNSFYKANDPIVLISGAKSSETLSRNNALKCRYSDQLITGLSYNSTEITIASMNGKIPAVDLSNVATGISSLLEEFFFLDPNNATLITINALKDTSKQAIIALTSQMSAHTNETGILPDINLVSWQQPWSPLFLLWIVNYYPIPHDNDGIDNWTFDGTKYTVNDGVLPLSSPQDIPMSGITLLTPQSSFNFKNRLDAYRKNHPKLDADELTALEDFITKTDDWDFLSQTLDGFMQQLACRDQGSNVVPAQSDETGRLIAHNNSIVPTPGGYPQPFQGWPVSHFQQYRAGQFCFEKLMVVDRFGQSIELVTSQNYLQAKPIIAPDMIPKETVLSEESDRFIQTSPRLLQPARLNFDFVSATDDTKVINLHNGINPICAWVLPNHMDKALACYDPDGNYLGELKVVTNDQASKVVNWEIAPNSQYSDLAAITVAFPHLGQMLNALITQGWQAFNNFYQAIDETLWVVDPLGNRDDQNLSILVGRPLALTRARLQYQLDGPAISDPSWEHVFQESTPDYLGYTFPVRLGELKLRNDGLIGYFTGANYDQFNSVHMPSDGTFTPTLPPYIVQVGKGNFIDLSFQNSSESFITMLVDPRAAVHATTAILPTTILKLPAKFVEPALSSMEVIFHAGPLLSINTVTKDTGKQEQATLLVPKPAEKNGTWLWLTQEGATWSSYPIKQPDANANLSNVPSILRTGMMKLSRAIKVTK